jgi:hypothetical protein
MRALRLALVVALLIPAGAAAAPVLSPLPGTPDAAPQTQLSIRGVKRADILAVRMAGTASGVHAGKLRAYSQGNGASFLPATPFAPGERVRAVVRVRGRRALSTSFTVARFAPIPPNLTIRSHQPDKLEHFVTEPALLPPKITVTKAGAASSGSIFLTPLPSPVVHPGSDNSVTISPVGPGGPMIVDAQGRLVWFKQLDPPNVAANLRIQRYRGKRVLTWWQGPVTFAAFGLGAGVIADGSYGTVRTVRPGNGYAMDLHEFTLTPRGTALFPIYSPVMVHLPGTPASARTQVLDAIVQEVDIATGLVVWEWHSLGHIPLTDSYATPENSAYFDAFHINSIQHVAGDRILISARDTSAIYLIDRAGGRIAWTLGGKESDFRMGPGASFWLQHDALLLSADRVSLFDDQAGPPQKAPSSRGLVLKLDHRRKRATVERQLHRPADTSAQSEGSVQTLPGGNVFVGWGAQPFFSEFSPSGELLFDASLPVDDGSYRVYRHPWSATPRTVPSVAVNRTGDADVTVHVSWNGATDVLSWRVLAGSDAGSLTPVATVPKTSFETSVALTTTAGTFTVQALGKGGKLLATSAPVSLT